MISKQEILDAQNAWGDGLIEIGKAYLDKGDYKTPTLNMLNKLYGYEKGSVLFKPTRAAKKPFRLTIKGALSYFIAGDPEFPEDTGFALEPWKHVRFENADLKLNVGQGMAMGHYFITDMQDQVAVVEYSFGYERDATGALRIILHHSSMPFKG